MDQLDFDPSSELAADIEALRKVLAEAEDFCAEFAAEMYREAKRLSKELKDAQR